jgi:hypothetical protein
MFECGLLEMKMMAPYSAARCSVGSSMNSSAEPPVDYELAADEVLDTAGA